jgi:hypothetical protein
MVIDSSVKGVTLFEDHVSCDTRDLSFPKATITPTTEASLSEVIAAAFIH